MKKILVTPRQFFLAVLLLPILVPLLFLLMNFDKAGAILFLSLIFGGAQYLIFAILVTVLLLRNDNIRFVRRLVWLAPLLFVPIQGVGWILWRIFTGDVELNGIIPELIMFGIYSILVGYVYVLIASLLYYLSIRCGFIVAGEQRQVYGRIG
jgi:hypothetical protein